MTILAAYGSEHLFAAPSATMTAVHPPGFEPMLASAGGLLRGGEWALEPKLDGWRALVHVGPSARVFSRPGREMTAALPALAGLADAVPAGTVLDGELVSGSGRPGTFYRLAADLSSPAERRQRAVSFVAFDVLAVGGVRVTAMPYAERRALLIGFRLGGPAWWTVPSWTGVDPDEALAACEMHDIEGVMAKAPASPYRPGRRSAEWVTMRRPSVGVIDVGHE